MGPVAIEGVQSSSASGETDLPAMIRRTYLVADQRLLLRATVVAVRRGRALLRISDGNGCGQGENRGGSEEMHDGLERGDCDEKMDDQTRKSCHYLSLSTLMANCVLLVYTLTQPFFFRRLIGFLRGVSSFVHRSIVGGAEGKRSDPRTSAWAMKKRRRHGGRRQCPCVNVQLVVSM